MKTIFFLSIIFVSIFFFAVRPENRQAKAVYYKYYEEGFSQESQIYHEQIMKKINGEIK